MEVESFVFSNLSRVLPHDVSVMNLNCFCGRIFPLATCLLCTVGFQGSLDYKKVHADAIVIDMHNDVVQRMLNGEDISQKTSHGSSDLPRFLAGGVDAEFFSVWVPPGRTIPAYKRQADVQIDTILNFVRKNSSLVSLGLTAEDIRRNVSAHKFVVMMGMEGGHPLQDDLQNLDHFYQRGVRYLTLTWNNSLSWATSAETESALHKHPRHSGLSPFGVQVVRRMNALGMVIDVSHVGEKTFWDVIRYAKKPVIASHSSAWALCHHWRNLKDDQLKAIARNGGVVCVNFAPGFLDSTFGRKERSMKMRNKRRIEQLMRTLRGDSFMKEMYVSEYLKPEYDSIRPPLSAIIDHIDYVAKLIGVDHVGIGSDFDGLFVMPQEMDDISYLPNITRELIARGYDEHDVKLILGENILRVLEANERK